MHDGSAVRRASRTRPPAWQEATDELYRRLFSATLALTAVFAVFLAYGEFVFGDWRAVDAGILLAVRALTGGPDAAPAWFAYFARDLTALGGVTVLSLLVFAVTGFLAIRGHARTAIALLAITVGGWLLSHSLKIAVARPRPDLVPHGMFETTASFPSGHALVSMIVFVTLGSMLARVEAAPRVRAYLFYAALGISLAIGLTRIFLGVHWPTDVLGGWIIGLVWITLGMRVLDMIVRRDPPR